MNSVKREDENETDKVPNEKEGSKSTKGSAMERIERILQEYAKEDPRIKLIVVTDESGLAIGAYPVGKSSDRDLNKQLEMIGILGGISAEIHRCVFEALEEKAPNIAGRVVEIVVGLKGYKIEFHRHLNFNIIIFKSLEK